MPRVCRVLIALLFFPGLQLAFAANGAVSVPFTTNSDGLVILPAQFGSIAGHVFFDTGAGLDVLAPSVVQKLAGKPAGHFTGFRMGGERLDLDLYTLPELRVGPLDLHDHTVATWDALDSPDFTQLGVQGIISLRDFRNQPVTFDFVHKTIIFETAESLAGRRKVGEVVPLAFDDFRGISLDSFAHFSVAGKPGQCEIDMGSPGATISTRYLKPLGINTNAASVRQRVSKNIAGATVVRYDTAIPSVALDGTKLGMEHPRVAFSDIIYDCVIGLDFWQGRAVTWNIAGRELVVSR